MKYAFITKQGGAYPVRRLCQALSVSPSGYYAWRGRPVNRRQREDRRLKVAMRSAFRLSRQAYGSPRLQEALATQGLSCSRKRVARLMREEGMIPKKVRRARRTTHSIGTHPKAPNLLNRQFTVNDVVERHQTNFLVHFGARVKPHHPELRLWVHFGLDLHSSSSGQSVVLPPIELRLVHDGSLVDGLNLSWPLLLEREVASAGGRSLRGEANTSRLQP